MKENSRHLKHDYKFGDQVLLYKPGIQRKLSTPKEGPYVILKVHANGMVKIWRRIIEETVHICRLEPFFVWAFHCSYAQTLKIVSNLIFT